MVDYRLVSAGFTPRFTMLFTEGANATTTPRLYGKGPGSVIDGVTGFSTAAFTNAYAIGTGVVTTLPALHSVGEPIALNLWRPSDGNGDPAESGALQIGTWTGDGSATRTIGLAPSGFRPVFVIVFADNGSGFWRDPSHTSTNSANSGGVDTPNGITAGAIDSFTVGSALNSNGVDLQLPRLPRIGDGLQQRLGLQWRVLQRRARLADQMARGRRHRTRKIQH